MSEALAARTDGPRRRDGAFVLAAGTARSHE
jgi:hypothetical protein